MGLLSKDEIKNHEFFDSIDWELLYKRKIPPPIDLNEYKPCSRKGSVNFLDADYKENNQDYNRVKNFTFIRSPKNSELEQGNAKK